MLRLYDSLTRQKVPFTPQDPNNARVYVCGPTVYDYSHIGHARCYIIYDVLVRHLRANGQKLTYVRNITDIDDKILKRSKENGETTKALSERFTLAFQEDMEALGNIEPDIEPKVSEHMGEIISMIETLIEKGHAYEADGDVYYSVESFENYGKLSGRKLEDNEAGASARLDTEQAARKRHASDFALWKKGIEGVESFESPWGDGRPGWHIECSAMSTKHLGDTLDLHGGGLDLVFPHHENELAQAEGATGHTFCNHWMHNGFVEVDKTKMGKSLGNFFTARDLFERLEPEALRLFTMTVHYRSPLNLDWSLDAEGQVTGFPQIEEAEARLEYMYKTQARLASIPDSRRRDESGDIPMSIRKLDGRLAKALNDDLNMSAAIAVMSEFLGGVNELCDLAMRKKGNASNSHIFEAEKGFVALETRLGLGAQDAITVLDRIRDRRAAKQGVTPDYVEGQIAARAAARADKDFAASDAIRAELTAKGVELHDSPDGTTWTMTS
ncbi:MAG: cysteinyl-tRNA synthetase [Polyangiales bacterium]|jgi:cysteinyl-tRNA synthetase